MVLSNFKYILIPAFFSSYLIFSPNYNIFNQSKSKEIAGDNLNVVQITITVFNGVENIVGKGENAGYQHFLLFPQSFS